MNIFFSQLIILFFCVVSYAEELVLPLTSDGASVQSILFHALEKANRNQTDLYSSQKITNGLKTTRFKLMVGLDMVECVAKEVYVDMAHKDMYYETLFFFGETIFTPQPQESFQGKLYQILTEFKRYCRENDGLAILPERVILLDSSRRFMIESLASGTLYRLHYQNASDATLLSKVKFPRRAAFALLEPGIRKIIFEAIGLAKIKHPVIWSFIDATDGGSIYTLDFIFTEYLTLLDSLAARVTVRLKREHGTTYLVIDGKRYDPVPLNSLDPKFYEVSGKIHRTLGAVFLSKEFELQYRAANMGEKASDFSDIKHADPWLLERITQVRPSDAQFNRAPIIRSKEAQGALHQDGKSPTVEYQIDVRIDSKVAPINILHFRAAVQAMDPLRFAETLSVQWDIKDLHEYEQRNQGLIGALGTIERINRQFRENKEFVNAEERLLVSRRISELLAEKLEVNMGIQGKAGVLERSFVDVGHAIGLGNDLIKALIGDRKFFNKLLNPNDGYFSISEVTKHFDDVFRQFGKSTERVLKK